MYQFTKGLALISCLLLISGCELLEDQGSTTVGSHTTTPPDFTNTPSDNGGTTPPPDNNPPTTPTNPSAPDPQYPMQRNFLFVDLMINNGDVRTKDNSLHLDIIYPDFMFKSMKISANGTCSGGTWEDLAYEQDRAPVQNAVNTISVRYLDYDDVISQCIARSIVHDNKGPDILFTNYPSGSLEEGATAQIGYSVTDLSPITSVICKLNQLEKPCLPGTNTIDITALPEGQYVFSIDATDILGNSSSQNVSWSVVSTTKHMNQNILVNNYNKVDILIVDDNSGSMEYEQQSMASRVGNLLSVINGLDWRIAVTTTDPTSTTAVNDASRSSGMTSNSYGKVSDGLFIPIYGTANGSANRFYIDSTMNYSDAQQKLGMTLQRPETGSGSEQAIYATYRAIERSKSSNNPAQQNFFRSGSHFAVLVISDEDESANGSKNDPQNLANLVNQTFNGQKAFSWHSIITRPGDTQCKNTYGAAYGNRYDQISRLTGGLIGSVCETDYAAQLTGIANEIRQLVKTMTLSCVPLTQFPITITKDGSPYTGAYTVDGLNLKFIDALPPGQYALDYHCLK